MKHFGTALGVALLVLALSAPMVAAGQKYGSWGEIASGMKECLDDAGKKYAGGDAEAAKAKVNDAYFGFYEKMGFERAVLSYISGKRAATVEYKFSYTKKLMTQKAPKQEVDGELALLNKMLREDANQLDGTEESAAGVFIASEDRFALSY